MTFHEVFRRACWRHPAQTFLFCDDESITYAAANQLTDAVAASFRGEGLKPGDRVDVVMENSIDAILMCLASWKAGLLSVTIDPRAAADDLAFFSSFASPAALVYDDELEDSLRHAADVKLRIPREGDGDSPSLKRFKRRTVSSFQDVADDALGSNRSPPGDHYPIRSWQSSTTRRRSFPSASSARSFCVAASSAGAGTHPS